MSTPTSDAVASAVAGLPPRTRHAVELALAWHGPVDHVEVQVLVDYAAGRITAQQYAGRLLAWWGVTVPAPPPESSTASSAVQFDPVPSTPEPEPPVVAQQPVSQPAGGGGRESAVDDFVSGRIGVEDFLRRATGR